MSSSEAIPVGHIRSAWCEDDDAGDHQPHWHYHHLPSAHLGEVKAVNVLIKGSPPPPLDVTQFFLQHRHLERHKSKFNNISSEFFLLLQNLTCLTLLKTLSRLWKVAKSTMESIPNWSLNYNCMCLFDMIRFIGLWTKLVPESNFKISV